MDEGLSGRRHGGADGQTAGAAKDGGTTGGLAGGHDCEFGYRPSSGTTEAPVCVVDARGRANAYSTEVWDTPLAYDDRPLLGVHGFQEAVSGRGVLAIPAPPGETGPTQGLSCRGPAPRPSRSEGSAMVEEERGLYTIVPPSGIQS